MAYRRSYRSPLPARPARWMDLRYAGRCAQCGGDLPAGTRAFYDPADRSVCCTAIACAEAHGVTRQEWIGSPVSGQYVTTLSDRRIGRRHAEWTDADYANGRSATQTWKQKFGRCEDAPCCGCCP